MSPVPLPDLILLAAILAVTGTFLLALGALGLLEVVCVCLMGTLSPRAAHAQRLRSTLDRTRPEPRATTGRGGHR